MPVEHESPDSKALAGTILDDLTHGLAEHGFVRAGDNVASDRGDVVLVVALNKDSTTRRDRLVVSCNTMIHCRAVQRLYQEEGNAAAAVDIPVRKLKVRHADFSFNVPIGELRHWTATSEAEAHVAASEMLQYILADNLPRMEGLQTPEQMHAHAQQLLHEFQTQGGWGFHLPALERRLRTVVEARRNVAVTQP